VTPAFTLVDSTLRDGSHAVAHQFDTDHVRAVVRALDAAGVPMIEVSHGDGLGGSSFNYGFSKVDELELLKVAVAEAKQAKIAALLLPGIGVATDLYRVREAGVTVARIAAQCTEADITEQHIGLAKQLGMTTIGFLMMAHMLEPAQLLEQAELMESYGVDAVYVTDSAGALTVDGVRARIGALAEGLSCGVGIHAHNNLQLAVANSLAAHREGATFIDACTRGLGAGAGNTPTEVLVAACDKLDIPTGVDTFSILDAAEDVVAPMMDRPQIVDRAGLLLGYAGVYSSFLLHAERAADRFGVKLPALLMELGRRKIVGGQEDMIVDIAAELAVGSGAGRT
jgi:4-hydroxy 2-oxovalerate aldolase